MVSWFKNLFRKSKNKKIQEPTKPDTNTYKPRETYVYKRADGTFTFKLGDKVICRSNECDPLTIGTIIEFWDNEGKWDDPIPYIMEENGDVWGINGIIRPYSDELMEELKDLRPLEQWNHFVPEQYQYSEEDMVRKQASYDKRQKFKEKFGQE